MRNWQRKRYIRHHRTLAANSRRSFRSFHRRRWNVASRLHQRRTFGRIGNDFSPSATGWQHVTQNQQRTRKDASKWQGQNLPQNIPESLTITNCTLVYPEANSCTKQDFLWPFYALDTIGIEEGQTNWFRIYQPLTAF